MKVVGYFLLSLFFYSQVYNTSVWVNYALNTQEITDEFCENVDKPEMNCHGVCHLKKQIIQTSEPIPSEQETIFYYNEIQLFSNSDFEFHTHAPNQNVSHKTLFKLGYSFLSGFDIFHPPQS